MLLLTSCLQPSVSSSSSSASKGASISGTATSLSASNSVSSSATSSSATASSTGGQTSQTSAITSSSVPVSGPYRVNPKTSTASTLNLYSVTRSGSSFVSTVTKTLTKGSYYTTYEDVAAYWIGFGQLPVNYVLATSSTKDTKKSEAYSLYGEAARLWFTYNRTTGYMTQFPPYNTYGDGVNQATYYELDIASNWSSYSSNRGAIRLVAMPYGLTQYGVMPVIFYTPDHYASFTEYYNYSGGWGESFTDQSSYQAPTTVSVTY